MNLQEQRFACLRMAMELGCKADSIVQLAREMSEFIEGAPVAAPAPVAEAKQPEASPDAIAACGTALTEPFPAAEAEEQTAAEEPAVEAAAEAEPEVAAEASAEEAPAEEAAAAQARQLVRLPAPGQGAARAPSVTRHLGRLVVLSGKAATKGNDNAPRAHRARLHAFQAAHPAAAARSAGRRRGPLDRSGRRAACGGTYTGQESFTGFAEKRDTRLARPAIARRATGV